MREMPLVEKIFEFLEPTIVRTYHDTDRPDHHYMTTHGPKTKTGLLTALRVLIDEHNEKTAQ